MSSDHKTSHSPLFIDKISSTPDYLLDNFMVYYEIHVNKILGYMLCFVFILEKWGDCFIFHTY
jgi:hypothetical protein